MDNNLQEELKSQGNEQIIEIIEEKRDDIPLLVHEEEQVLFDNEQVNQREQIDQRLENAFDIGQQQAVLEEGVQLNVPAEDQMISEINQECFQEKKLYKSRESKIKNKKSRLYRKEQNASKLADYAKQDIKARDARAVMRRNMSIEQRQYMTIQQARDLSELADLLGNAEETEEQRKLRIEQLTEQMSGVTKAEAQAETARKDAALAQAEEYERLLKGDEFAKNRNLSPEQKEAERLDLQNKAREQRELIKRGPLDKTINAAKLALHQAEDHLNRAQQTRDRFTSQGKPVPENAQRDLDTYTAQRNECEAKLRTLQAHYDETVQKYAQENAERNARIEQRKNDGHNEILTSVSAAIMQIDLNNVNLFDDAALADNQALLEKNMKLVGIYRRMVADAPEFENTLENQNAFKKQLEYLTAVSDLYRVRKLIVTNDYYKTHYNEELSMEVTAADTPQKKYLAKLLRTSYYLGKNLRMAAAEKQGRHINALQPMPLNATSPQSVKANNTVRKMSRDDSDWAGMTPEEKARHREELRTYIDHRLYDLEYEKDTIPSDDNLCDLEKLANEKITSDTIMNYALNIEATRDVAKTNLDPVARRKDRKMVKLARDKKIKLGSDIHIENSRFGKWNMGDNMERLHYSMAKVVSKNMTDEEFLEFFENLNLTNMTLKYGEYSAQEGKMAENAYFDAYRTYMERVNAGSKWVINCMGDALSYIHLEDLIKMAKKPEFMENLKFLATTGTNMTEGAPLPFMKAFSGLYLEHLEDTYDLNATLGMVEISINMLQKYVKDLGINHPGEARKYEAKMNTKIRGLDSQITKATALKATLTQKRDQVSAQHAAEQEEQKKAELKAQLDSLNQQIEETEARIDQLDAEKEFATQNKNQSNRMNMETAFDTSLLHKKINSPDPDEEWDEPGYIYDHMDLHEYHNYTVLGYDIYKKKHGSEGRELSEDEKKKYFDSLKSRHIKNYPAELVKYYNNLPEEQKKNGIPEDDNTVPAHIKVAINKAIAKYKDALNTANNIALQHGTDPQYLDKSSLA